MACQHLSGSHILKALPSPDAGFLASPCCLAPPGSGGGAWPGGLGIARKLLAGTGQTALGLTLAGVEVSYIVWSSLPAEINIALELRLFLHPLCSVCSQ